jgi:C-terminal, D2-small domain, of ClpB protein
LLKEGTDLRYGARHLKRAIEKNLVYPLANLVSTGQVKLHDFIEIDLSPEGRMIFTKQMGNTMNLPEWERIPVPQGAPSLAARAAGFMATSGLR